MNIYPRFIPPGSGYVDYESIKDNKHIGLYYHMDWDTSKTGQPISYYHPYYLHHIYDNVLSLRDPVTAASIELGIGKHLLEVVRFANGNNLGYSNERVGVGYFLQLGVSGNPSWWLGNSGLYSTTVNSGIACVSMSTDYLIVTSGYFNEMSRFAIDASNNVLDISSAGSGYIDKIDDVFERWSFSYGNVYTIDSINLLSGVLTVDNLGSGSMTTSNDITFFNNLLMKDVNVGSGILSGFFDTYQLNGVDDESLVTYNVNGHSHNCSGWSSTSTDTIIVGNTIFDGRYFYSLNKTQLLRLDSRRTSINWTPIKSYTSARVTFNSSTRVYKDKTNLNVVNSNWAPRIDNKVPIGIPNVKLGDKVATINELIVYGFVGDSQLRISDGRTFALSGPIQSQDEFYFINNDLYFIHSVVGYVYIYQFNGLVWKNWSYSLGRNILYSSCVSNHEVFLILQVTRSGVQDVISIIRFNTLGIFRNSGNFKLFGVLKQVSILDHDIFCLVKDWNVNIFNVYIYNFNRPIIYQKLFSNIPTGTLSIYYNSVYNIVQVGKYKKKIYKNKSTSLPLDAIGGVYNLKNNIVVKGTLKSNSTIMALCADSLFREMNPIYKHVFLLEPGRNNETNYSYGGNFTDTFINRYLIDNFIVRAHTYNDLTCSIVYKNSYYFGHRGDISTFLKTNNKFQIGVPAPNMSKKIITKFLPTDQFLYALVQDFDISYKDFTTNKPEAPISNDPEDLDLDTNFIPYIPGPWSIPVTRLYKKAIDKNTWIEDKNFSQLFGLRLIDAITYDNNLYVIAHNSAGSGIVTSKFNITNNTITELSFSGVLKLNESLVGSSERNTTLYEFTPQVDGTFVRDLTTNEYPYVTSANLNGHHEFYLYNHPFGPYVVHDQVEILYQDIQPSSIYGHRQATSSSVSSYDMKNTSNKYLYRTIGITFLREEYPRQGGYPLSYSTTMQTPYMDLNNPNIKIPIQKDNPIIITTNLEDDKFLLKDKITQSSVRNNTHFVTSITHNKNIYIIVQVDQKLKIYSVKDFSNYFYKTTQKTGPTYSYTVDGAETIYGDGVSYAGIIANENFIPSGQYGNTVFLDFVPCELSNTLITELDLSIIVGEESTPLYILGDGDDLFITKPKYENYKHNKRFCTHSTMVVGSNVYLPLTCRIKYPTGKLLTFLLGFFSDGSVGLVDNNNIPTQIVSKPIGRSQFLYKDGKWIISAMSIVDGQPEYISYEDMKKDPIYGPIILKNTPESFGNIFNPNTPKKWIIGEYDIQINDNLNVRETF